MYFQRFIATTLLGLAPFVELSTQEGINCHGSALCASSGGEIWDVIGLLQEIDGGKWANNGELIACKNNLCAFTQNSGGAPISSVQNLAVQLANHGCDVCGSIPLFYPDDNNVNDGELTVNFISNNCFGDGGESGVCPEFR